MTEKCIYVKVLGTKYIERVDQEQVFTIQKNEH